MTTTVTKYNYGPSARSKEIIDRTRRSHKPPPLLLNPLQFSKLAQLANVQEEKSNQKSSGKVEPRELVSPKQVQEQDSASNVESLKEFQTTGEGSVSGMDSLDLERVNASDLVERIHFSRRFQRHFDEKQRP